MLLREGYNAIRWPFDTVPIAAMPWAALIRLVYTDNFNTGVGYLSFEPGDALSNMRQFAKGLDYLVLMCQPYEVAGLLPAPAGAFAGFPGYVPPVLDTAPILPVGRTELGVAAESIIGGRLVAQTVAGLRHYSSAILEHEHLLFGVATNSALKGGSVTVRRPGYVRYDGWGLPPNQVLLAGNDGRLTTQVPATSFYQVIGRSLTSDVLLYQPEIVIFLSNPHQIT